MLSPIVYKNVLDIATYYVLAIATYYTFPQADKVKEYLKDLRKFVVPFR